MVKQKLSHSLIHQGVEAQSRERTRIVAHEQSQLRISIWQCSLIIYTIYTNLHYVAINRSVYGTSAERFRGEIILTALPQGFKKSRHNVHYNRNIMEIVKQVVCLITILLPQIDWACDFHLWCYITWLNLKMVTITVLTPFWLDNDNLKDFWNINLKFLFLKYHSMKIV